MTDDVAEAPGVIVWTDGALGRLKLNRPKALNAVDLEMVRDITAALQAWRDDPAVKAVLIEGEGEKALCAGGDIRALADREASPVEDGQRFLYEEYQLNAMIAGYEKPYIALMDGLTMGGGVGVSAHGSHRIVTERTKMALPECSIGFLPDVGSSYLLSRSPGQTGIYLAVTGQMMNGADAIFARLADSFVPVESLDGFISDLVDGLDPDEAVQRHGGDAGPSSLQLHQADISDAFAADRLIACQARLDEMAAEGSEWAQAASKAIGRNSPLCMRAAFEAIHQARGFETLEECLAMEYRYVSKVLDGHELQEGVRAILIDKDKNPKWEFATIGDVPEDRITDGFAGLGPDEWRPAN